MFIYRKSNRIYAHRSVARGDAYPDSDLDLYILLEDGQKKRFYSEMREDILVEYKYADFNQIQVNFKNNQMELYSFLEGKILFDKSGELKELKAIAKQKFENYRVASDKVKGISHWLHSSLIKIKTALKANIYSSNINLDIVRGNMGY